VRGQNAADDDRLMLAEATADADRIAFAHDPVCLRAVAVDRNLAAFARALRLGARLEQARDVEPDVETNAFG